MHSMSAGFSPSTILGPGMICRQIKAVAATAPRQDDPTTPILREEMIEDA